MKSINNVTLEEMLNKISGVKELDTISARARLQKKITEQYGTYKAFGEQLGLLSDPDNSPNKESTIKSWFKRDGHLPPLETLYKVCQLLDCEVGNIIGDYNEDTKAIEIIKKETGLSTTAIKALQASPTLSSNNALLDSKQKALGAIVSFLLTNKEYGLPLLQSIADYIFSDEVDISVRTKKEKDYTGLLHIKNKRTNTEYMMDQNGIDSLLLTQIQGNLIRLKQNIKH
ncbi:MAG: hypothetical protein J6O03_07110 [Butyrivibrio sp.]|nr:hypothetical protein [Butyrivibrio sp.]